MPLQATSGAVTYDAYGGGVTAANYIEDVFSTWLYTGTGVSQTITNGIDLSTKGGLVWTKARSSAFSNGLVDTARGVTNTLVSNNTDPSTVYNTVTAFNTNGFTVGTSAIANGTGTTTMASWTFRKQSKFFDVVTYTGNGSARTIAHSLGSVPGCMIIKRTDDARDWAVYHRSSGATKGIYLNSTAAEFTSLTALWNGTTPTSTEFSVGTNGDVNASGGTYVAYLFAHDAGGFGRTGTDNVISCGSFTTPSGSATSVNLGYEPQFVLFKATNTTDDWYIADNMRGFQGGSPTGAGNPTILRPNTSQAEGSVGQFLYLEPTGFNVQPGVFSVGTTFIYIAIRRGPMKTPTTGTSVYEGTTRNGTGAAASISGLAFPPDAVLTRNRDSNSSSRYAFYDKLRGPTIYLDTAATDAEFTVAQSLTSFNQTGESFGTGVISNANGEPYINWQFRRAPGFFDVVCYTGNGTTQNISHNLGVAPELMFVKRRDATFAGRVYSSTLGNTKFLILFSTAGDQAQTNTGAGSNGEWNATTPTNSVFSVGTIAATNNSGSTYVAYLFASCPGVSKVGSYTGTGTTLQIDCGFTGGARFVLIKRTDSTGDWYCWDSSRGIVSGNDSYLVLNSTAAEVTNTDWVDTYSAGFELSNAAGNNVNINTATYIFLSVA